MASIYKNKSINRLIFTFALPAILSLIVETSSYLVDTMFAGHLGDISSNALTAMGLLSPLINTYTAFQALFSLGTSVLIAKHLEDKPTRDKYFKLGILASLALSTLLSIISSIACEPILIALGARGEILSLTKEYLRIHVISIIFSSLGYTFSSCIRAFGHPKAEAVLTTLSVVVNIAANAIFCFGAHLGVRGISLGTLVSEIFCAVTCLIWLYGKKTYMPKKAKLNFHDSMHMLNEMFKIGIAQTLIQTLGGVTGFFINASLLRFSGTYNVAAYNIVQQVYYLILMPVIGLSESIQTIIAYFEGQGLKNKKRKTIALTLTYSLSYGIIGTVLAFLTGKYMLPIFGAEQAILDIAVVTLKIAFSTFSFTGIYYTIMSIQEVTGHEFRAMFLAVIRQVLVVIPFAYIFPLIFKGNPYATLFALPLADAITLIISLLFLLNYRKNINKNKPKTIEREPISPTTIKTTKDNDIN